MWWKRYYKIDCPWRHEGQGLSVRKDNTSHKNRKMPGMHVGRIANSSFIWGSIKSLMEDAKGESVEWDELYECCSIFLSQHWGIDGDGLEKSILNYLWTIE